jgi:hypothetical protein
MHLVSRESCLAKRVSAARDVALKFYPLAIWSLAIGIALLGGDDGGPRSEAVGGAKRSGPAGPLRRWPGSSARAASGADWWVVSSVFRIDPLMYVIGSGLTEALTACGAPLRKQAVRAGLQVSKVKMPNQHFGEARP